MNDPWCRTITTEAHLEAAKAILRFGYQVALDNPLWILMALNGKNHGLDSQSFLGIALLKKGITLGCQDCLHYFIEYFEKDLETAIEILDSILLSSSQSHGFDLEFQNEIIYQKAQIKEKQGHCNEAFIFLLRIGS